MANSAGNLPGSTSRILMPALQANGRTSEDYALVARTFDSGTMEPLIMVAGITQYGTQAAGEFITSPEAFSAAISQAPSGWQRRNPAILLHIEVLGRVTGQPKVLATRFW